MKILLADDDRTTRTLLTRTLQTWGHEVTAVADGLEAWERVQTGAWRVLLSDWEMPGLDGPALCAKVRAMEGTYVYTILLTSHDSSSHVVEGLAAGADDYVSKPYDPPVLRARLSVAQRLLALQDELAARNEELARANTELSRIATTDALLDIGNRRSFEDVIVHTHQSARRFGSAYGVLLADIDHFKRCNDTHGHAFGDKALARTAWALKTALGDAGKVFRYGGEEIIAVVNASDRGTLVDVAEQLRGAVERTRVEAPNGQMVAITVSIGAALFEPTEAISAQVVVEYADASLYHAKQTGRNRVVAWPFERATRPRTSAF